ncbi:MAG TPA: hypothetical protein VH761_16435, partial [Ilumatobacteraceae bacterium]
MLPSEGVEIGAAFEVVGGASNGVVEVVGSSGAGASTGVVDEAGDVEGTDTGAEVLSRPASSLPHAPSNTSDVSSPTISDFPRMCIDLLAQPSHGDRRRDRGRVARRVAGPHDPR